MPVSRPRRPGQPRRPAVVAPKRRLRTWLLAGVAGLLASSLVACGSGSSPTPLPALHPDRPGPTTMFTPNKELLTDPERALGVLRRLGVETIHLYLHWADIAPYPTLRRRPVFDAAAPGAYPAAGWVPYDTAIRDVYAHGMQLIVDVIPSVPYWASAPGAPHPPSQTEWKPSASDFGQFMHAVGVRYGGHYVPPGASAPLPRVRSWSIWNEPNLGVELAPETIPHTTIEVAPRLYRGLVDVAWSALKSTGHGADQIMIGELAPLGAHFAGAPGLFSVMAPLRFLRALYCVDASYRPLQGSPAAERGCPTSAAGTAGFAAAHPGLFRATAFAIHPYTQGLAPNVVTPNEPDFAELSEMPKLARTLDTLQSVYGSATRFPLYDTEFGYQTTPPDPEIGTVSPGTAAVYLNWSEYLTWLNPRLRSYDQYLLYDSPLGNFATGLESVTGVPKPTFAAFRMPVWLPVTRTSAGAPLLVWGCVRPAHFAALDSHQPQRVQIQFADQGSSAFHTVRTVTITNPHGYFEVDQKFPGSGSVRLAWAYPHGSQITSRTVSVTVR